MLQDRIKQLCSQLLSWGNDHEVVQMIAAQLRHAIHEHVENLRQDAAEVRGLQGSSIRNELPSSLP